MIVDYLYLYHAALVQMIKTIILHLFYIFISFLNTEGIQPKLLIIIKRKEKKKEMKISQFVNST